MAVLVKWQKVDLTKTNPKLNKIKVGLRWDTFTSGKTNTINIY